MDEKKHVLVESKDLRWMEEKGATGDGCHLWTCCWRGVSAAAHTQTDAFKELFMNRSEVTGALYHIVQQSTNIGRKQYRFVVDPEKFTVTAEVIAEVH